MMPINKTKIAGQTFLPSQFELGGGERNNEIIRLLNEMHLLKKSK